MKGEERSEFEALLDAYFGARIDDESIARLNRELSASAEARRTFWKRAKLEQMLESWGQRRRGEVTTLAELQPARPWWRQWPAVSGWAAAVIVLALLLLQSPPESRLVEDGEADAPKVAVDRAQTPKVRWAGDDNSGDGYPVAFVSRVVGVVADSRYLEGQSLGAGEEVRFSEGMMEVTLFSGARVAVQGPARFIPQSDLELAVAEGQVQADVPESAIGFRVLLPDGEITDFGTSFDFKVEGEQTSRVQVLDGEIELADPDGARSARRMTKGQAVGVGSSGQFEETEFSPLSVGPALEQGAASLAREQMQRWSEACRRIDADESVIVHFSMLPDERGARVIRNRSRTAEAPRSGTVISASWSNGRWPGKPALSFLRPTDRVRMDIPGEFPKVSFVAWVRIDGLPRHYNGLFYSEYGIDGEVHWQFNPDGSYHFGVRPKGSPPVSKFHRATSGSVISQWSFGSWRMLATTYDSEKREVIHFVDGEEVSRSMLDDSIPLQFGRATLGNYFDPDYAEHAKWQDLDESWSFRNWTGAIDEFVLFSRIIDPKELTQLYEAGRVN